MSQDEEEKEEKQDIYVYIRNKFYQQIKIRKEKEVNE